MRVMVIIKATDDSEAGALPDEKLLTDMEKLPSVRGDLLFRLGRPGETRVEFERARECGPRRPPES